MVESNKMRYIKESMKNVLIEGSFRKDGQRIKI